MQRDQLAGDCGPTPDGSAPAAAAIVHLDSHRPAGVADWDLATERPSRGGTVEVNRVRARADRTSTEDHLDIVATHDRPRADGRIGRYCARLAMGGAVAAMVCRSAVSEDRTLRAAAFATVAALAVHAVRRHPACHFQISIKSRRV